MKLLTAELRASLPSLYAQEKSTDPTVHAKFFTPDSQWTWYTSRKAPRKTAISGSSDLSAGMDDEWDYFVLSELESVRGPLGLPIERDLYFEPGPFTKVMARERRNRGG
jgi:Protein of unknown function (DUF2958)